MGQSRQGLKQQVTGKVKSGEGKKAEQGAAGKRERLAAALRANLLRRKAQAEARKAGGDAAPAITSPQSDPTRPSDE